VRVQLSWNQAYELEHVFGGSGKQAILDAVNTEDAVIAVGHVAEVSGGLDDAAVWRSVNGQSWKVTGAASLADIGDQRMIAVTEFEGGLVAAGWDGSDAAVWVSSDGRVWTPSTSPALAGDGLQRIRDLVSSGSQLVAVGASGPEGGQDAAAWISDDGETWVRMTSDAFAASGQQEMWGASPLGARLVVIGYTTERGDMDPAVWLLEEEAWSRVDPDDFDESNTQIMLDIAGGERGLPLVAVGCEEDAFARCDTASSSTADAAVWTSDDGRSWERVITESGRLDGEGIQVMRAVVTYRGSFVAVGTRTAPRGDLDGGAWISADGLEWRAPGPLASTAAALGGVGDQSLRALVRYGRGRNAVVGFGVTDEGVVEDAQVWTATFIGA
jgi:hypothetical protein